MRLIIVYKEKIKLAQNNNLKKQLKLAQKNFDYINNFLEFNKK